MTLETMTPDPDWDPADHPEVVATLKSISGDGVVRVWCGDWCGDCQAQLPAVAAALAAAGFEADQINTYAVEKLEDGSKQGPLVDDYRIEYIPTIVIEREGMELARYVEGADPKPAARHLADTLAQTAPRS